VKKLTRIKKPQRLKTASSWQSNQILGNCVVVRADVLSVIEAKRLHAWLGKVIKFLEQERAAANEDAAWELVRTPGAINQMADD
jgi:hypothetical protein